MIRTYLACASDGLTALQAWATILALYPYRWPVTDALPGDALPDYLLP